MRSSSRIGRCSSSCPRWSDAPASAPSLDFRHLPLHSYHASCHILVLRLVSRAFSYSQSPHTSFAKERLPHRHSACRFLVKSLFFSLRCCSILRLLRQQPSPAIQVARSDFQANSFSREAVGLFSRAFRLLVLYGNSAPLCRSPLWECRAPCRGFRQAPVCISLQSLASV